MDKETVKRPRGRPRIELTPEELAAKEERRRQQVLAADARRRQRLREAYALVKGEAETMTIPLPGQVARKPTAEQTKLLKAIRQDLQAVRTQLSKLEEQIEALATTLV